MRAQSTLAESLPSISQQIWEMKYRLNKDEASVQDSFWRVAKAVAAAEKPELEEHWATAFYELMADMRFLPAGRILAGAGTGRDVTLFNCFVMGRIDDSIPGIFNALNEAAQTLQQGGGIGHDFSSLRPKGALVHGVGAEASGPLSFMEVWDAMCRTIMSAGARRGAMMGTLRCDHPDIEAFIEAKRDKARLRNFNVSVLVTDAFMAAVDDDALWPLMFDGVIFKTISARGLWTAMMQATFDCAEPGVIFIDRINGENPLAYCETIACTNPCGEQPLPAYGAC
ncbi:MAG: ribonucleoside-diphosphate reductase, adenosylcobalamin-dependent, partial [Alphaproteobacteria bacterium]|nr:ribonucleoside-diphosphate reductase, adenosylcobalamin-dependent [Alphaproteobacteria bacterium]